MEALSKQPVIIVIEADQFFVTDVQFRCAHKFVRLRPLLFRVPLLYLQIDLNRTYMSFRLAFLIAASLSLDASSCIAAISGDPDLIDDSVFDDLYELLSLLQSDVSLKMSVAVKANGDFQVKMRCYCFRRLPIRMGRCRVTLRPLRKQNPSGSDVRVRPDVHCRGT